MNTDTDLQQLLRWRLAQAEAEAPPTPRAALLLEKSEPWWIIWPERFQNLVEHLARIEVAVGYAMTEPMRNRGGHPVPTLLVRADDELETSARILYLDLQEGSLRLRFCLEKEGQTDPTLEATFISASSDDALFSAPVTVTANQEYRIDVELPGEIAVGWTGLKVTDRMPFRFILRSGTVQK